MKMSRGEMQDLLAKFSAEDESYRAKLIEDPRLVISKQFGYEVPANVTVQAVEETADTVYVVIPHVPGEGELDDADLEQVAGGLGDKNAECSGGAGLMMTQQIFNF